MDLSSSTLIHIFGGTVGLLSGFAALFLNKGSELHRAAGNVFFITMLIMSASGAYLAYYKPEIISVFNGALTFYLVATAWAVVMRDERKTGVFEIISLIVVIGIAAGHYMSGIEAMNSDTGLKDDFPPEPYFLFGSVAVIAALSDISAIMRGGLAGKQRIARHLWRMCFAMFIASAAFFLGQMQIFPSFLQEIYVLASPVILVLVLMFFWLARVLFTNWWRTE